MSESAALHRRADAAVAVALVKNLGMSEAEAVAEVRRLTRPAADAEIPDVHDDPSWGTESAEKFGQGGPA